jgi:serine phosphatase RsbU (regulator of sigma subunit)
MARQLLGFEHVSIAFVDHDTHHTKSRLGAVPEEYSRFGSFCNVAIERPGILVVPDATKDPRFKDSPSVVGGMRLRFYAGHSLEGPGGERVGTICVADTEPREFSEQQAEILRDLAVWVEEELAHSREMSDSTQVQRGLLPQALVTLEGYDVAGMLQPVRAVSGDFYDWYPVRGGAAFTLADAMGKGVPAALVAATVRATMRASSRFDGVAAAVESADEALEADIEGSRTFVTLFHAHLEEKTGILSYIDAGHGLTLLVRADGTTERLASTGLPLGVGWEATWEVSEVEMRHGDLLVSVSDGVLDGLGGALDALDRVADAVRSTSDAKGALAAVAALLGPVPPDDVTLLIVRREPGFLAP